MFFESELLLWDGCITGGILIVRGLRPNASQRDEEKAGRGETLPFAYFPTAFKNVCVGGAPAPPPHGFLFFSFAQNWQTAKPHVGRREHGRHGLGSRGRGCLECGLCVGRSWGGPAPRRRVWPRRREISLCDWHRAFYRPRGRAETDPGVSLWVAPRRLGGVTRGGMCVCPLFSPSFWDQIHLHMSRSRANTAWRWQRYACSGCTAKTVNAA